MTCALCGGGFEYIAYNGLRTIGRIRLARHDVAICYHCATEILEKKYEEMIREDIRHSGKLATNFPKEGK